MCVCVCVCTHIHIYNLNKLGIKTVTLSSKTICDLLHSSPLHDIVSDAGVYCIPCKDFKLKYIGKTARNVQKSVYKHKIGIRLDNLNNSLLLHILKTDHNLDYFTFISVADEGKYIRVVEVKCVVVEIF